MPLKLAIDGSIYNMEKKSKKDTNHRYANHNFKDLAEHRRLLPTISGDLITSEEILFPGFHLFNPHRSRNPQSAV